MNSQEPFLLGIDLEDIRSLVPDGGRFQERVPANTERLLEFLEAHGARCTFFTTGDVARRYPSLVARIAALGHEIASHSSDHLPLDRHDPESFRADLEHCIEDFGRAGVGDVRGFRAPIGSLIRETRWAYDVLREAGFTYSASVLAARSPLYGWPDFGPDRARREGGIWELPVSLTKLPGLDVPFAGGVYFRVLPRLLIRHLFRRRLASGAPVIGYLHPYDFDTEQERFAFPEINGNPFYNWLMYHNRDRVFPRLEELLGLGTPIVPYAEYVAQNLEAGGAAS